MSALASQARADALQPLQQKLQSQDIRCLFRVVHSTGPVVAFGFHGLGPGCAHLKSLYNMWKREVNRQLGRFVGG